MQWLPLASPTPRPRRRGPPRRLPRRSAALVAAALLAACAGASVPRAGGARSARAAGDTLPPGAWRAMPCPTCRRAGITVETRRSVSAAGGAGEHAFARLRNHNPHAVALVASFVPDYVANSEGIVPAEHWPLQLGAAGSGGAERVVMLRRPWAREAAVHDVERF